MMNVLNALFLSRMSQYIGAIYIEMLRRRHIQKYLRWDHIKVIWKLLSVGIWRKCFRI